MASPTASNMPQEIWWLVCQELTTRQDFDSLFKCALVSKAMAHLALPLLYSIQEISSASAGGAGVDEKDQLAHLWRTLILSSIGQTAYPYCLWIKILKLGDLAQLLRDISTIGINSRVRSYLFRGPMKPFEILSRTTKTRSGVPVLQLQKIVEEVGDRITDFVRGAADRENKSVSLTSLEGEFIPTSFLTLWTSRLSTLTSFRLHEGSTLTGEVAEAIRDNCPAFKELTCYFIKGPAVDEDMAAFFLTLPPNTMEAFTVLSWNQLGQQAFTALTHHAKSLTKLNLCLGTAAFPSLNALSPCQSLTELQIEANTSEPPSTWATDAKDAFLEVSAWLKESSSLTQLKMWDVSSASTLLAEVLKSPNLRLKSLDLKLRDDDEALYASLGHQTALESLKLRTNDEFLDTVPARHLTFIDSVCSCRELRDLDLMQIQLAFADIWRIKNDLLNLEEFSFDIKLDNDFAVTDDLWLPLRQMRSLKALNIYGLSVFTFEGILSFINALEADKGASHQGFGLYIMAQFGDYKFSEEEEGLLAAELEASLGGRLDLTYWRDPDEEMSEVLSD